MQGASTSSDQLKPRLQREANRALRAGAFWAMLLGVTGGALIALSLTLGLARGVEGPLVFSLAAGGYSAIVYLLARQERLVGWVAWAVFLPFALLPSAFFAFMQAIHPAGAALFINGPLSYLTFFILVVTGFMFDFWLSAIAGLAAAAAYFAIYLLARGALGTLSAPDPLLLQDLTAPVIYLVKSFMMIFGGLGVGALALVARGLVVRAVAEERQRAVLDRLFGEFVSEEVKERLVSDPRAQRGERKEVVILFSDIRGFTAASEQAAPEAVVERLNAYLEEMVQAIAAHGGVIDKFIGDAVMAVFGGLLPLDDPCAAAVRAAREMRRRLAALNARWEAGGEPSLENGIGVHRGTVLQGTVGSQQRKSFTVIGDAVNTASRIEGLTKEKGCPVLISGEVYERLPDELKAELESLGSSRVKGRRAEVELWGLRERGS